MIVPLKDVWKAAREREPGFLDDVLEHSQFNYNVGTVEITREEHDRIDARWSKRDKIRGLGDVVKAALRPFVKATDALLGTDLENCAGCEDRRQALNDRFPIP